MPITILNTPKATGSFLNSVFQNKPSCLISSHNLLPSLSRSTSGPQGLTSRITRDLATGGAFFFFYPSWAFFKSFFAASFSASSSLANGSYPSSESTSSAADYWGIALVSTDYFGSGFFSASFSWALAEILHPAGASGQVFFTAGVYLSVTAHHANVWGWASGFGA